MKVREGARAWGVAARDVSLPFAILRESPSTTHWGAENAREGYIKSIVIKTIDVIFKVWKGILFYILLQPFCQPHKDRLQISYKKIQGTLAIRPQLHRYPGRKMAGTPLMILRGLLLDVVWIMSLSQIGKVHEHPFYTPVIGCEGVHAEDCLFPVAV